MLKIFKDMMQRDKRDPEKTNLLKEKHRDRKRKHYSASRSKSGRTVSSSSEHPKHEPYKMAPGKKADFEASQHTLPFQNEKRESWWFWGDANADKPADKTKTPDGDDTCSCVSCALKKLIGTDYACIACITLLLVISVLVAIMLLYKSMPCATGRTSQMLITDSIFNKKSESERLKRKIGSLGKWSFGPNKQLQNIFKSEDPAFGSFGSPGNDMSSLVESENELSRILDTDKMNDIQQSDRLRGFYKKLVQTDAAIRNLRKSLNDNANIANNFEINSNFDFNNNFDINNYDINSNTDLKNKVDLNNIDLDRLKRSINFKPGRIFNFKRHESKMQSKIDNGKLVTKTTIYMTNKKEHNKYNKNSRKKRYENFTGAGFIIEKDKVMIQYKPTHIVAKCSHSPQDSKSHEKDLTHPFYKNTQRLDALLDQFIDKKLPDLLADRVELGVLFGNNKNKKCKHPSKEAVILVRDNDMMNDYDQNEITEENQQETGTSNHQNQKMNKNQNSNDKTGSGKVKNKEMTTTAKNLAVTKETTKFETKESKHSVSDIENSFFQNSNRVDQKNARSTTGNYDVILSISTLINPVVKKGTSRTTEDYTERSNLRKLLQANMKAEDGIAYEDLKEVLADYKEGNDDEDKESDRKKRDDNVQYDTQLKVAETKYTPLGVHNPNWKGPMPLYPDELTQMTNKRQESKNKVEIPVHNRDSASETDELEPIKTDMQYVEDYLDNGYERLAELAQAYSDYGVLNDKKDPSDEKKAIDKEHSLENRKAGTFLKGKKIKIRRGFKRKHFFEKLKQGRDLSEGIRIEFQPTPKKSESAVDDVGSKFREIFNKHVKISGDSERTEPDLELPEITTRIGVNELNLPPMDKVKDEKVLDSNKVAVFKKRTLKASDDVSNSAENKLSNDHVDEGLSDHSKMLSMKVLKKRCSNNAVNRSMKSNEIPSAVVLKDKIQDKSNNSKEYENDTSLSSFFMTLAKWFSAWDEMETSEYNNSKIITGDKKAIAKNHSNESESIESQLVYPAYDSDMIENIGHRSRVLLSAEDTNDTEIKDHLKSEEEKSPITVMFSSTEPINVNTTRSVHETTEPMDKSEDVSNKTSNRVVKRQAIEDSNLIFWNDLYDEEYGINAEPIENNIRDKHSAVKAEKKEKVEKNEEDEEDAVGKLLKKSNSWLQDKMKKISDRLYPNNTKTAPKKEPKKEQPKPKPKHAKRNTKYDTDDDENAGKLDLVTLTERMKAVCKETVKAIQETKHIQVRNDNKEGQAAASLMQQLVRLMTDLVDFQVQERTCRRLPPDLQVFLEWLTSSKEDDSEAGYFKDNKNEDVDRFGIDFTTKMDKPTEQDLLQPSERENTDSKTDCLGTLHAVQNLIREYEEMTEDDKSVMTGVKDYLENQMHFLQRQLSSFDDSKYFNRGTRYKRDIIKDLGHTAKDTYDSTAQQLEKQYKELKKMFHRYKGKVEPSYNKAVKTTSQLGKAVTDIAHDLFDPDVGKDKTKQAKVIHKHTKVFNAKEKPKEQLQKEKLKLFEKEKIHKTQTIRTKPKMHKHRNMNKLTTNKLDKAKENSEFNDDLNYLKTLEDSDYTKNVNQPFSQKDIRKMENVYNKAMEQAKKASILKGSHKRDSDTFDKTDIFRIYDYLGEKED